MDTPLIQYVQDINTPYQRRTRDIENHYHLQMAAENTNQIRQYAAASLALQAEAAWQQHQDMADLGYSLDNIQWAIEAQTEEIRDLGETARRIEQSLDYWLQELAEGIARQQVTMDEIADTLRRPLETTVKELLQHAHHAIASGGRSDGRRRAGWYQDALDLLSQAVQNPVGKQDYIAWFQTGFVLWKRDERLAEAAEAFDRAARLSQPAGDVYYWESLRHLAYMYYLQGDYTGALEAIREALRASENPHTLFDGARYWARNGNPNEAVHLLEQGIEQKPIMIVEMLSEEDFGGMLDHLRVLTERLVTAARSKVRSLLDEWSATLANWQRIQKAGSFSVRDPQELTQQRVDELMDELKIADYLRCLAMAEEATAARTELEEHAADAWGREEELRRATLTDIESSIKQTAQQAEADCEEVQAQVGSSRETHGCLLGLMAVLSSLLGLAVGSGLAGLLGDNVGAVVGVLVALGGPVLIYSLPTLSAQRAIARIQEETALKLEQLREQREAASERLRQIEQAGEIGF
jgi:tetratricopeptide (TPR) repeat protein